MNDDIAVSVKNVTKSFKIPINADVTLQSKFLNGFKKTQYKEYTATKNLSFDVKKGEFFSVIGPNGAGKSTLLKLISGIYAPDKGTITVNGKLVPFLELGVGFNPELTARENVYLNGTILGLTENEIKESIEDIFEFAEIKDFADLQVKKFSSGMQVRLAFSVAIRVKSDILVLDEVLAVGDGEFQKKCFNYFDSIIGKKTILFVSHGLDSVRKYSNRVLWLKEDKTYEIGDPNKLVDEYSKTF
ncbi:ABC transporter ATP-binding protein [bacterium]|nr:ABC transporter ATP-binding protein [bacterium]